MRVRGTLQSAVLGDSPSPQPSQRELLLARPRRRGEGAHLPNGSDRTSSHRELCPRWLRPIAIAQVPLDELARRRAWQLGFEIDRARAFERRQMLFAVKDQLGFE